MKTADGHDASVTRHLPLLLLLALVGFFVQIHAVPLFDLDEGAFGEATREMLANHNWLLPTLNGEPRYDKPILIYWLQAASASVFGLSPWALRLPSCLCATLWMLAVYRFARRQIVEPGAAMLAAGGVALSLMAGIIGHAATADALLNLTLSAAFFQLYEYFQSRRLTALRLAWLWIGFGMLTKGPVALLLPGVASLLWALSQRQLRSWLRAALDPLGWLIAAAVVAPWVIATWQVDGGNFIHHFLFDQNVGRYQNTMQGHGGKPWYYLVALPLVVLPFTVAMVPTTLAALRQRDPLDQFLLFWFLLVFVVFSFSATQLPHYILYGCTPLFILCGRRAGQLPPRAATLAPALLLTSLVAALPWVLPLIKPAADHPAEAGMLALANASLTLPFRVEAFAAVAAILVLMVLPGMSRGKALLYAAFVQALLVWFAVVPVIGVAQQDPVREAAARADAMQMPVVSYRTYMPSFSIYRGDITPNRLPEPGELVFVQLDRIPDLQKELPGAELVPEFRKGGVALLLRSAGSAAAAGSPVEQTPAPTVQSTVQPAAPAAPPTSTVAPASSAPPPTTSSARP